MIPFFKINPTMIINLSSLQPSTTCLSHILRTPPHYYSLSPPHHHLTLNPLINIPSTSHRSLQIHSLEHYYDYESSQIISKSNNLKIALIGFGNFGQFLAKTIVGQGHTVLAHSRSNHTEVANRLGVSFFANANHLCEQQPDIILLCTSILSTENVLRSLPLHKLKPSTLFIDVLSVKEFPKNLFIQILPPHFDILCTHPMFGPESGRHSWNGLSFVYDRVRIGSVESRFSRCEIFLDIFAKEGCRMVEMTCEKHDRHAAGSQFITHTIGRILEKLGSEATPINSKGYETLLNLVENTANDSFDLYFGLFVYNKNAMEQLERLNLAFESLKEELFAHLHEENTCLEGTGIRSDRI